MSAEPRIVIEHFFGGILHVLDLPDAEHIHVTRGGDGAVTAVPMRSEMVQIFYPNKWFAVEAWVDVEGGAA
jgi:hypothetical protein